MDWIVPLSAFAFAWIFVSVAVFIIGYVYGNEILDWIDGFFTRNDSEEHHG